MPFHKAKFQGPFGIQMDVSMGEGNDDTRLPEKLMDVKSDVSLYEAALYDSANTDPEMDLKDEGGVPEIIEEDERFWPFQDLSTSMRALSRRLSTCWTGPHFLHLSQDAVHLNDVHDADGPLAVRFRLQLDVRGPVF